MPRVGRRTVACFLSLLAGFALVPQARALELMWSNPTSSYGATIRSVLYPATVPVDEEAADDFQAEGTIERLIVRGRNDCTFGCYQPPQPLGVWVRFYESTPSGPGALQYEEFLAAGDPGFQYNAVDGVGTVDLTLAQPFPASGWHFLGVQVEFAETFAWYRSPSNDNAPVGAYAYARDNQAEGGWQQATDYWGNPVTQDLAVDLYGCPPGGCPDPPLVAGCGEWTEIPSPNPNGDARLEDVHVQAPWDVWAVGSFNGPIDGYWDDVQQSLAMHWNGSAWSIVPTPNPAPTPSTTQVDLLAVSGVTANDVWAVGRKRDQDAGGYTGGRVLAMHWDGFDWEDMNAPWPTDTDGSPFTGASGEQFYDVVAIASDDVWVSGRYWTELPSGVIQWPGVAMRWNGGSFERYTLPMVSPSSSQWGLAIAAVSSDEVWIVGDGEGADSPLYTWHWDGSSWAHVPGPTPGADRALTSVVALAANDVWAGGWYRDELWNTFAFLVHWDGSTWTEVPSPAGGSEFAAWGPNDILTFGTNGWAHWDGTSWSETAGPQVIPSGVIRGLAVVNACELWAVGWRSAVQGELTLTEKLVAGGNPADDTDGDGVPNVTDNCPMEFNPDQADCDGDGAGDVCELVSGTAQDCNGNLLPDNCESFTDCNQNAVPDECEPDCNANGVADACDIAGGASADCNSNGVPDDCDAFPDCNTNDVNDWCDIDGGTSADANSNGYPDECEALGPDIATVTIIDDVVDFGGAQQMADLPGPDGQVSMREAVLATNNTPGPQTIAFNIPPEEWTGSNPTGPELRIDNGLFFIDDDGTTLDFDTQTAFTGDTNSSGAEVSMYGFEPNAWGVAAIYIAANQCTVKGIGRVAQRGYAVQIAGNDNRIIGSRISGPIHAGVYVTGGWEGPLASRNLIGGAEPGEGNVISGGDGGVRIDAPAADNTVVGNVISGGSSGVQIRGGAFGNRIGGPTIAERNVISGSGHLSSEGCPTGAQIEIWDSDGNLVQNNWIGLTPDGLASEGQAGVYGVLNRGSDNTVIRDNVVAGILSIGANHCAGDRFGEAIAVEGLSDNVLVENNLVGFDAGGQSAIVNRAGVTVEVWPPNETPSDVLIQDNRVANSELWGVRVGPSVQGVTITGTEILDNGGLGIDLSGGAGNAGQAAPELTSATTDDISVHVQGTLASTADRTFRLEFFANSVCDSSGAGEGARFLGSIQVVTDPGGLAAFDVTLSSLVIAGEVVTATATDLTTGNTSEFSTCATVSQVACSAAPPEVQGVYFDADDSTIRWQPFGPSVQYDVARDSVSGPWDDPPMTCMATGSSEPFWQDMEMPGAGEARYYVVRAVNACGAGPWGPGGNRSATCP